MHQKYYITTSIPFVNARPHLGFALELVQADVIARYYRLIGNPTRFQTGTDENAAKNVESARREGIAVDELVTRNSQLFQKLSTDLNISIDHFVRTTSLEHRQAVPHFWHQLKTGDIYKKSYSGLYCTGCEDYYLEKDLVDGLCPDHGVRPVEVQEENYFFRLSNYQVQIQDAIINSKLKIIPEFRRKEILNFVSQGLQDISVSRPAERSEGWGIPVPGDSSQIVYVWIDALINYISGLGYGSKLNWNEFWNTDTRKIHVIGKNVWKFHAIYWPALLLSAGLPLPDEIMIHGFLTENGHKISKSSGRSIDPFPYITKYGSDPVRYYLLKAISPFVDGDFSHEKFVELYNADLANDLGNLVGRLSSLCEKAGLGKTDYPAILPINEDYHEALSRYEYDGAFHSIWRIVTQLNQDIDQVKPWKILKEGRLVELRSKLEEWLNRLYSLGYWLSPLLPETSMIIRERINSELIISGLPLFPRLLEKGKFRLDIV